MRSTTFVASAFLAVALAGCADGPVSDIPRGDARIVFASGFSYASQMAALPIERVRLTSIIEGDTAGVTRVPVNPNADEFVVDAIVDLGGRDSATVHIVVELLSLSSGSEIVEWSAMVGPILVVADEQTVEHEVVTLIRGPIDNQLVVSVAVSGPSSLQLGASHPAFADVVTEGSSHTVVWSSSNPQAIAVDPVGDSIDITAVGLGSAWVTGAAGMHADSFFVTVTFEGGGGPVAEVFALPDSATMVPGTTRQWFAYAVDENEIPTFPSFTWMSLDGDIASVGAAGLVTAHALGRARIVVSAEGIADTAIVNVQPLPDGVDIMWQGGTAGAETDWFTPDNWSPARVPTASDVVYLPFNANAVELNGDTEIGGLIGDTLGGFGLDLLASTLTIHGDMLVPWVYGSETSRIILDAPSANIYGFGVPNLTLRGDVHLVGDVYVYGDLDIEGGVNDIVLDVGDEFLLAVEGDMTATNTILTIGAAAFTGDIFVQGDVLIDGGDWSTGFIGGSLAAGGDFTVTDATACGSFAPQGGVIALVSDTSRLEIGCAQDGNRFHDLYIYPAEGDERMLELASDVVVANELYLDAEGGTVFGNGFTFRARFGSAYYVTMDNTFIEVFSETPDDAFSTDSVFITGMTGASRPQVVFAHPGMPCSGCYGTVDVRFDQTSSGPYIEVIDTEANGDSVVVYMPHNPGDGPNRVVTSGEAAAHWGDVPMHLLYWSGSGQTGTQNQPLPDSLVARIVDYAFFGVDGEPISWTVDIGDGSVSPAVATTDADGLGATEYTLGASTSSHQVIATSASVPEDTIFFAAFATTAPAGVSDAPANTSGVSAPDGSVKPVAQPAAVRRRFDRPTMPARPEAFRNRGEREPR